MEATTRIELVYTVLQFYLKHPYPYRFVPNRPFQLAFFDFHTRQSTA